MAKTFEELGIIYTDTGRLTERYKIYKNDMDIDGCGEDDEQWKYYDYGYIDFSGFGISYTAQDLIGTSIIFSGPKYLAKKTYDIYGSVSYGGYIDENYVRVSIDLCTGNDISVSVEETDIINPNPTINYSWQEYTHDSCLRIVHVKIGIEDSFTNLAQYLFDKITSLGKFVINDGITKTYRFPNQIASVVGKIQYYGLEWKESETVTLINSNMGYEYKGNKFYIYYFEKVQTVQGGRLDCNNFIGGYHHIYNEQVKNDFPPIVFYGPAHTQYSYEDSYESGLFLIKQQDEDNPDEPDPDNPDEPDPSYFEYKVQYSHNFVEMSKDNYLQGLDGHGPNIWLNFDNDGTDNYGTVTEQDAQQKWTNSIFDYKTQDYFEHPTAGCTQPQPQRAGHFAGCRISFRGMGPDTFYDEPCTFTKDDLNLLGFGVTTKFDGIIWTYAFYFVKNSSTVNIAKDDTNNTIQILVGLDGCDNGKILCQRIVKALCESSIIKDDTELKEIFAHPSVDPYHINDPWTIGQDEIIFWNSEHFGVAGGFEPKTLKKTLTLNATYNGPIIKDGNNYDKNDVSATITYTIPGSSESKTVNLKQEEFTVDSTLVLKENAIGELICEFTVSYQEQLYGESSPTIFTDTIEVPILYLKEFKAEYTGPYIYIVSDYDVNDVTVSLIYNRPEYNKILDQSEYDLSTTTIDKLGINTITVTEHSKDHYKTTFIVIGVRIVLDISAKYVGPPIEITDKYNPLDVIVSLDTVDDNHENRMTIILKYSPDIIELLPGLQATDEYLIQDPGLYVTSVGDNIRTVFYKDPLIEATTEFIVPGIPKLVDFETIYIGDTRIIGERVYKSEVLATASWIIDNDYTLETKILEDNEWEFYDAPIITNVNKGYIRTQYKNLMSSIKVKYDVPNTLRLRCWYEGVKIKVGSTYEYEDVPTFLVFPNGDLKRLRVLDLEFSSNYVAEEGWNWYTVTYRTGYYVLSGVFAVPGYIPIIYPDVDFMVRYIDIPNNYREIDYTEKFRPKFTFDGVFVITWQQFLAEVNELMLYGLYILTAPKLCGLSNKYDQDWEVLCINKTTLKANIMKTYLKEEDLPWQEQNQLKQ